MISNYASETRRKPNANLLQFSAHMNPWTFFNQRLPSYSIISLTTGPESEKDVVVSSVETREAGDWTMGTVAPSSAGIVKLRADIIPEGERKEQRFLNRKQKNRAGYAAQDAPSTRLKITRDRRTYGPTDGPTDGHDLL